MAIFSFTIYNDLTYEQEFLIDAEDLIEAHMKAIDFVNELDEKIFAKHDVHAETSVVQVSKVDAKRADEAGVAEYLEEIHIIYVADGDDD